MSARGLWARAMFVMALVLQLVGAHADKLMHVGAGALVALPVFICLGSGPLAFAAAAFAGIGKELYDVRHRDAHTPSLWDIAATALPGLLLWVAVNPEQWGIGGAGFA